MNVARVVESFEEAARTLSDCRVLNDTLTVEDLESLSVQVSRLESRLHDIQKEIYADEEDLDTRLELAYAQRDVLESRLGSHPDTTPSRFQPKAQASGRTYGSPQSPNSSEDQQKIPAVHAMSTSPAQASDRPAPGLVSKAEFASISSYMRGRLTVDKINKAVLELTRHAESNREMVIAVRKGIAGKQFDRKHALWLSSNVVPVIKNSGSKYFVVDQDLKRGNHLLPGSNSSRSILTILRHLGRVSETRLTADGKTHVIYSLLYMRGDA